jgi:hypothetical protein
MEEVTYSQALKIVVNMLEEIPWDLCLVLQDYHNYIYYYLAWSIFTHILILFQQNVSCQLNIMDVSLIKRLQILGITNTTNQFFIEIKNKI